MRTFLAVAVLAATAAPAAAVLLRPASAHGCGRTPQLVYDGNGITLLDADGTQRHALTHDALDEQPTWSPDGTWLAFLRLRHANAERGDVWLVRADGTQLHRVTHDGRALLKMWRGGRVTYIDRAHAYAVTPEGNSRRIDNTNLVYSPDGRRFAYDEVDEMSGDEFGLATEWRELVPGIIDDYAWAPDSRRIAFTWSGSNVSVVDAVTGVITPVTHWPPFDRFDGASAPALGGWSPDGRRLTSTGPGGNIFVLDTRGGRPRQLTDYDIGSDAPAPTDAGWSPDGRLIAFIFWNPENDYEKLFVVSPDHGRPRAIATLPYTAEAAAWRPCN